MQLKSRFAVFVCRAAQFVQKYCHYISVMIMFSFIVFSFNVIV